MPGLWAALRHCGKHASISSLDARLHCPPRFFSINKQAIPVWKLVAYDWFGPTKKTCNDMRQCHEKNAPVWCLRDCIARFLPRLKERFRSLVAMISCPYKCASTNTVVITRMAKFGEVVSVSTVALIGIATADSTRQLMGKCQLTYSRASHHGWFSFSAVLQLHIKLVVNLVTNLVPSALPISYQVGFRLTKGARCSCSFSASL